MTVNEIQTPAILLNLDSMEYNVKNMRKKQRNLKVGDKITIIPNHSCSSANLTDYYIGVRNESVKALIKVDMRGNSTMKK